MGLDIKTLGAALTLSGGGGSSGGYDGSSYQYVLDAQRSANAAYEAEQSASNAASSANDAAVSAQIAAAAVGGINIAQSKSDNIITIATTNAIGAVSYEHIVEPKLTVAKEGSDIVVTAVDGVDGTTTATIPDIASIVDDHNNAYAEEILI